MSYVITWTDRDEQRYHMHGETYGTHIKEEADEYTKAEAETLIKNNEWVNCSIEKY